MLLGNKCDLPNKVVTYDMGQEFARNNGFGFMEVSAKSDIGIKAAFNSIVTNIFHAKVTVSPQGKVVSAPDDDRGVSIKLKREDEQTTEQKDKKKKNCC